MNNLKHLRTEKKITQSELGQYLGVGQSTVAMWETGINMPRAELLPKIAKLLGCTVDELLQDE